MYNLGSFFINITHLKTWSNNELVVIVIIIFRNDTAPLLVNKIQDDNTSRYTYESCRYSSVNVPIQNDAYILFHIYTDWYRTVYSPIQGVATFVYHMIAANLWVELYKIMWYTSVSYLTWDGILGCVTNGPAQLQIWQLSKCEKLAQHYTHSGVQSRSVPYILQVLPMRKFDYKRFASG